jgi:hypothetical protein
MDIAVNTALTFKILSIYQLTSTNSVLCSTFPKNELNIINIKRLAVGKKSERKYSFPKHFVSSCNITIYKLAFLGEVSEGFSFFFLLLIFFHQIFIYS